MRRSLLLRKCKLREIEKKEERQSNEESERKWCVCVISLVEDGVDYYLLQEKFKDYYYF